jgi:hypothetical protein
MICKGDDIRARQDVDGRPPAASYTRTSAISQVTQAAAHPDNMEIAISTKTKCELASLCPKPWLSDIAKSRRDAPWLGGSSRRKLPAGLIVCGCAWLEVVEDLKPTFARRHRERYGKEGKQCAIGHAKCA